jgi:uncharacterized membrane protein
MMPGMSREGMMDQSTVPPGWTYSPSSWLQRLPIIALGFFGFLIARYLAAYQLGQVGAVWEPFFSGVGRNGTEFIITSAVSRSWPIPDAGLGAAAYLIEALMGAMGTATRWRTMPWMVAFFFVLVVVPLGGVSIFFIIIQPIVIGTYCTLCLLAALAMLVMIPLTLDEVVAMGQYMQRSVRGAGRSGALSFVAGLGQTEAWTRTAWAFLPRLWLSPPLRSAASRRPGRSPRAASPGRGSCFRGWFWEPGVSLQTTITSSVR